MGKLRSRLATWTRGFVSIILGTSGFIAVPPGGPSQRSLPDRIASVRAALAQQGERVTLAPDTSVHPTFYGGQPWGNFGNWNNWGNFLNWNNWGNWGNWGNWVNY